MKTTLKQEEGNKKNSYSNVRFRIPLVMISFPTNSPSREEWTCWKDVIRHCIDLVSHPFLFFPSFSLAMCPVRWFSMFIERSFKKFVKPDKRWECVNAKKKKKKKRASEGEKEKREKLYMCLVQWLSQFHHDEMHLTSLVCFSLLCWLLSFENLSVISLNI